MADSAAANYSKSLGNLDMGINLEEIHNVAVSKLQKLNALKEKREHLEEEVHSLTTVLQDLKMVKMNIEADDSRLACRTLELEGDLGRRRERQDVLASEASQLRGSLDSLRSTLVQDLQNYEAKMKMIFGKYQDAHENYVQQALEDRLEALARERDLARQQGEGLMERLARARTSFQAVFYKPQRLDVDPAALVAVLKQMEADAEKHTGDNAELRGQLEELQQQHQKVTYQLQELTTLK
ncbi:uncharacterized protein LOC134541613 [Bacillus rossius redtenbacheri]|uniref:uncharacterized protein LOC134541613 n=1 Tax=Bacillus rossius redtenbacheri TaxID=93214 RepID=UPI002FDE8E38